MILRPDGSPWESEPGAAPRLPDLRREPPLFVYSVFKTVDECAEAAQQALWGWFQLPAFLIEQTLRVPRVRGPFQTRMNGLTGTEIQWIPGRDNDIGRRAAKAIVEDWPLIASAATRYQLSQWGLTLGVGIAQKHWYVSPSSGRAIPRLEVFHPQWTVWDWALNDRRGAYRIWTLEGWEVVPSPALSVPGEAFDPTAGYEPADPRRWVVHEPFGSQSFRHGLIHAIWASALGWQFADGDMSRLCERQSLGGWKLKYPPTTDAKNSAGKIDPASALGMLVTAIQRLGRNYVIPVEQSNNPQRPGFDVDPVEFGGTGFEIVKGTKVSKAEDLAVLILGHNTTVSSTTAGASAGANVGNSIRGDLRVGDCWNEATTAREQVLGDWAAINFGDPAYAPVPVYITNDAPMANEPAARTVMSLAQAIEIYRRQGVPDDAINRLLNLFQFPIGDAGIGKAAPPAAKKPPAAPAQEQAA